MYIIIPLYILQFYITNPSSTLCSDHQQNHFQPVVKIFVNEEGLCGWAFVNSLLEELEYAVDIIEISDSQEDLSILKKEGMCNLMNE